jgi:hypothetical protein
MSDRYQLLTKEFVEGASIAIPIIAIKIDRGNAFLYAIIMTTIVLMTLRLSMQNEIKCIYDMVPMITNRQRSDAVVNCHVFAKSRANSFSFWWFLFAPSAIIVLDVLHNSLQFGTAANVFNSGMLGVFYMVQAVATIVLVWVNILCFKSARDLDRQLSKIDEMLENAKDDLGRA